MDTVAGNIQETAARALDHVDLSLAELYRRRRVPTATGITQRLTSHILGEPLDLWSRSVEVASGQRALVMVLDCLIDSTLLSESVLRALVAVQPPRLPDTVQGGEAKPLRTLGDVADSLLAGHAVVQVDGRSPAWAIDVRSTEHRSPDEPTLEPSIRGPREGFIEILRANIASIRRRVTSFRLRIDTVRVGRLNPLPAAVLYIAGRADPRTVGEVKRRLHAAAWDTVTSSQSLQSALEDRRWSLFPQVLYTERPDVCASALTEGRVLVLLEGTPVALIMPAGLWEMLQAPDDYYLRWPFGVNIRFLRLAALIMMMVVLPTYVAVVTFHHELIPTAFLLSLAASREGIPLPTLAEALGMNFAFDLLREASTRLPRQVGGALTIVGALVVGESAVRGGFISAPMVILIGLAALSAFALPLFGTTIPFRLLSYGLLLLAGTLGLFGLTFGLFAITVHVASLTSLGFPYLTPVAPFYPSGWEDVVVRAPWHLQRGRPPRIGRPPAAAGGGSAVG